MLITVDFCNFTNTRANLNGGAILVDLKQPLSIMVSDSRFEKTMSISGAIIYGELTGNSIVTLIGLTYIGNT